MSDQPFTADDVDQFHRCTVQALAYAESIVAIAADLQPADIGIPSRSGQPRTDTVWDRPRNEVCAESFVATGYMLKDELRKLDSLPSADILTALRVSTNAAACGHAQALVFCQTVLRTLHEVTGFDRQDDGKRTVDRPRPATEAEWQELAATVAPALPTLRKRLAEITAPDVDAMEQVMVTERDRVKAGLPVKNRPPQPGYLGIIIDDDARILRRGEKQTKPIPGTLLWPLVRKLVAAGESGLTADEFHAAVSACDGSTDAKYTGMTGIRKHLAEIDVSIPDARSQRGYRLTAST